MCMCLVLGGVGGEDWVWALPILWEQGECWTCVCFGCDGVGGSGSGTWTRVWRGGVVLCLCESGFSVYMAGPGTINKFIANYIKGRKAYTTYRNHTSSQRQFKTGVPQVASFHQHYSTYTLQTYHPQ